MLLAACDVASARALIRRGVASDRSLGLRGALPVHAHFLVTGDRARSVRAASYLPAGPVGRCVVRIKVKQAQALDSAQRVLLYMTGSTDMPRLETVRFVPGALADHFTTFGGQLDVRGSQMSVLSWIDAGATASHGTGSEPCSHAQKFPRPQVLLLECLRDSTAIEAYWKGVAWPQWTASSSVAGRYFMSVTAHRSKACSSVSRWRRLSRDLDVRYQVSDATARMPLRTAPSSVAG
jgi:uncharacterized protein (TIGR03790 family)